MLSHFPQFLLAQTDADAPALRFWPERASDMAGHVDAVFIGLMVMSALIVLLLLVLLGYALFNYKRDDRGLGLWIAKSRWKLETTWSVIPFLVFLGLFAIGAKLYIDSYDPTEEGREINVVGRQWMWQIYHPEGKMEHDQLHIPVGEPITLVLSSEDVIHSFYVPAFRVKRDVVPGKYVRLTFTANKTGRFHFFCAEYCGTNHSQMDGWVTVMEPEAYAEWLQQDMSGQDHLTLAERGREIFHAQGCSGCHEPDSTVHAPRLAGVAGSRIALQDGGFVTADSGYLRDSILLPGKDIVAGFQNVMPSYQGQIDEGQIAALIAYLQSLDSEDSDVSTR
ncbi:MAG: cytochrome c oxidase subunit II [Puniceicoccaceae bacterium 5H]|nr:MAG: cytochrome c oxidase subunit II [Puniceicoccaceae bacterium 5H]